MPTPAPAASRAHPTLKAWLSEQQTQDRLAALLVDPVFIALTHYISESMKVQPDDLIGSRALMPEELVRKNAMHVGVSQFIPTVKKLLTTNIGNTQTTAGWEHIHPDN